MQADKMLDDDKTSQNLRMLAYRSLQAAVKNTLDKKDAPRKILSAKELRLVTQIYHQQNYDNELLTILDSPEIGIDSEVGKNDVEFIRAKIEALLKLEKWEDLTTMCFSNLEKLCSHREEHPSTIEATPGNIAWADDWFVWRTLVNASTHTSKSESVLSMSHFQVYQTDMLKPN
jgi:N-terminal acetyltransferase B complex non-catalytic subunit